MTFSSKDDNLVSLIRLDPNKERSIDVRNHLGRPTYHTQNNRFDLPVEGANSPVVVAITADTIPIFHHHLQPYYNRWAEVTTDKWVLEIISGFTIPFASIPPTHPPTPSLFRDPSHDTLLRQEALRLLAIGAIERVPKEFKGRGFYSHYFLMQKKTGGWRPILDLRRLNRYLQRRRFKMVTLATIIPSLNHNWFAALDLQDTYFHITIHPAHRCFLCFVINNHFQYRVLPFGLVSTPTVFSRTLAVVAAYLHRQHVLIFPYLDDCFIKAPMHLWRPCE
nr:uncharacterized protein LOC106732742 [Pelodiscus sinensis]|eukprot:XP_014434504.1 uncharacterized protein LOC106732742 [Pelodiscus sinensis]